MLSGDGNENAGGKKSVGLITTKTTSHALFCTFLFAVVLHEFNVKLSKLPGYTCHGGNFGRVSYGNRK